MPHTEKNPALCIVGGGMTGLTLALLCAEAGIASTVVESKAPALHAESALSGRVSALNTFSLGTLKQLAIWDKVPMGDRGVFRSLQIWDALTGTDIVFNSANIARAELGYNVDNAALIRALWQTASDHPLIELRPNMRVERLIRKNAGHVLCLSNGDLLASDCSVGADGACSWMREAADIDPQSADYDHHALITVVTTEKPHNVRGRQVFLPSGPLALLPLCDAYTSAVVWSLPPDDANTQLTASDNDFSNAISEAFGWRLGNIAVQTTRQCIPLVRRHAKEYTQPGLVLIGDAAHSIHPLAGQGVNLGFRDAVCLSRIFTKQHQLQRSLGSVHALARYERQRRADNTLMLSVMACFHDSFGYTNPAWVQSRKMGMQLLNRCQSAKKLCMHYAMGLL